MKHLAPSLAIAVTLLAGPAWGCAGVLLGPEEDLGICWIGYTEYRVNLPGGRHANEATMRAFMVRADGTQRRALAEELTRKPDNGTQFANWSPDGKLAIIHHGSNSPENAALEEKQRGFRFEGRTNDCCLVDLASGKLTNLTAVERVSNYNAGLYFWPGDPKKLGFEAMVGGQSHPFSMDRDGRNKKDLTRGTNGFTYGSSASPDGKQIAYHKDYQVYIADADGSNPRQIKSGQPFNFVPKWSPDGQWLLFLSGEHYNCHPHVVRRDGTELRKVGDRNGYKGVVAIFDVPDFHGGSSDVPVWSPDGKWICYSSRVGESIELMRTSPEGKAQQLTQTKPGTHNYHPAVSPNGKQLVFGSDRSGVRQLYVMPAEGGQVTAITQVPPGSAAMWAHWQPGKAAGPAK